MRGSCGGLPVKLEAIGKVYSEPSIFSRRLVVAASKTVCGIAGGTGRLQASDKVYPPRGATLEAPAEK